MRGVGVTQAEKGLEFVYREKLRQGRGQRQIRW